MKTSRWQVIPTNVVNLLLQIELLWVSTAALFVYLSIVYNWASYIPWLCLAFAFAPFLYRLIMFGRPSSRTPFDIPIAVLLGGIIVGIVVSDYFDISLGAFQTFLVSTAFYYSLVNYSNPARLLWICLTISVVIVIIASVLAVNWVLSDIRVPNGLGITLIIIVSFSLGLSIFSRQSLQRVVLSILGLLLLGAVIFFINEPLHRLITLESLENRLQLWLEVISPIEGSSLWTGLGLGCWPLTDTATHGHVHNAYLELYINTGIFGLLALICFLAVGAKLTAEILYSPRNSIYYGFGAGVILASLAVLAVSFVESAAFGYGTPHEASYHYILTPIPFILSGGLVVARRFLKDSYTPYNQPQRTKVF